MADKDPIAAVQAIIGGQSPPTNRLTLNIEMSVDFAALADWPPQTLAVFMAGVAGVISAQQQGKEARRG